MGTEIVAFYHKTQWVTKTITLYLMTYHDIAMVVCEGHPVTLSGSYPNQIASEQIGHITPIGDDTTPPIGPSAYRTLAAMSDSLINV